MQSRWRFEIWWWCAARPFWAAKQFLEVTAESEMQAVSLVLSMEPNEPFMHGRECCHVGDWRLR